MSRTIQIYDHAIWYRSVEYSAWRNLHTRIENPKTKGHKHYKGKRIDRRYHRTNPHGFQNFLDDMGPRPKGMESLDRIDGTKGYIQGNLRWATWETQHKNQTWKNSPKWRGISISTYALARIFKVAQCTVFRHLKKMSLRKLAKKFCVDLDVVLGLA